VSRSMSATTARLDPAVADALMARALDEARAALAHDDVPIGAVVARLDDGEIVARAHNERELRGDPTAHAEVLALRAAAAAAGGWRLREHVLVSTIEPCPMCAGAAWAARVDLVVFGAADPRAGAAGSLYNFAADPRLNHEIAVLPGVRADECASLVERFFASRRTGT
jgi:tRNA(adenine34) deaminase